MKNALTVGFVIACLIVIIAPIIALATTPPPEDQVVITQFAGPPVLHGYRCESPSAEPRDGALLLVWICTRTAP